MASTDTYDRITATYADELRMVAGDVDRLRADLDDLGPSPRTFATALVLVELAVLGLREKAERLEELPTVAPLWADLEED